MNKKRILFLAVLGCLFGLAGFSLAQVQITDPLGIGTDPDGLSILLGRIATGVGAVIASLGVIMIIYAGILYLTSAGNPEKINKAKSAITYAIIGIAVGITASTIATMIVDILKDN